MGVGWIDRPAWPAVSDAGHAGHIRKTFGPPPAAWYPQVVVVAALRSGIQKFTWKRETTTFSDSRSRTAFTLVPAPPSKRV